MTKPEALYTVFNYQTGKSLEAENNKLGVKVKGSDWKWTYYPKQKYSYTSILAEQYDSKDLWIHNYKSASYSFTITYPKKCKDVVVGIGFFHLYHLTCKRQVVQKLNLARIMCCLFKDNVPLAELVLRIIIGKKDLVIIDCQTQKDMK